MDLTFLTRSDFWLDIIFPNRCVSCDKTIAWNETFCDKCGADLPYIEDIPWQAVFAMQTDDPANFDYANALFWYKGNAKSAVLALKSRYGVNFAKFAAKYLAMKFETDGQSADIITAVPMNAKKVRRRGYNQAQVFADYLSKNMDIKTDFALLKRRSTSTEQHTLAKKERLAAAESAYFISSKASDLSGKRVILCDDIFTSGATVNKCAALLKELGAKSVSVATICRTDTSGKLESNA